MCLFAVFTPRFRLSIHLVVTALFFALPTQAQVTQTLGSLDVDRLGAAVYTLPISAPNGVGGVKPNITALYNSQAANGLLGKGGSVGGLSVIKRCNQALVRDGINKAITWTVDDRFCIDNQRLMLITGTQGAADSQYKTEIDNGVVYTAKGGAAGNPDYFEARAEDGAILVFGGVATAKEQGAATMTWALSQYKDVANNAIEYVYEGTAADGLRIKRINYAFAVPNTTNDPGAYIEFIYKDRDDPISKYVAGYEFRTNKLLTQINSYSLLGLLHRSYQFDHATSSGLAGYVTRWQSVKECTSLTQCFDSTEFEWGRTQKNVTTNQIETKNIKVDFLGKIYGAYQSAQFSCCGAQAADLNGNGIAEFFWIQKNSDATYPYMASFDSASLSNDSPKYVHAIRYSNLNTPIRPSYEFADLNADGFIDVIGPGDDPDNTSRRLWRIDSVMRSAHTWLFDFNGGKQLSTARNNFVRSLDLDGDGFQEILGIDHRSINFALYKFNQIVPQNLGTPDYRQHSSFGDVSVRLSGIAKVNGVFIEYRDDLLASGDFNNDGKKDLLLLVKYGDPAVNTQTAKLNWYELQGAELVFKETIYEESRAPLETTIDGGGEYRLLEFISFGHLRVVDFNGDGLDDIVFKKHANWMYSINTGNGFLPFVTIPNNSNAYPVIKPTFIDVNNDGSADYIYGETTATATQPAIYVRYWNAKIGTFDGPVFVRATPNKPILFADMNGDGFTDIVENQIDNSNQYKDAANVYGFTNNVGNTVAGFQGVLDQDVIVSVKAGSVVNTSIDYQTLIRPKNINVLSCTSGVSGVNPCYDFASTSHYKPLKIDVPHNGNSLDGVTPSAVVNSAPYYTKTNEPFLGLNNPYAGAAKVAQYVAPFPIVTRVKNNLNASNDKKYYYEVMRTQSGGRGLLGFEKTSVEDVATGVRTETFWRQDWPFTGLPINKITWNKFGKAISETENTLVVNQIEQSQAFKVNISKIIEKQYETKVNDEIQGGLICISRDLI